MDTERALNEMFEYLDTQGVDGQSASAEVQLPGGRALTVRAGGPGVHSWPVLPPFTAYEVLLDHDPPRFWRKYADEGSLYATVPRLLLAHHITRTGGVVRLACKSTRTPRTITMNMVLMVDEDYIRTVRDAVEQVVSTKLISSNLTFSE